VRVLLAWNGFDRDDRRLLGELRKGKGSRGGQPYRLLVLRKNPQRGDRGAQLVKGGGKKKSKKAVDYCMTELHSSKNSLKGESESRGNITLHQWGGKKNVSCKRACQTNRAPTLGRARKPSGCCRPENGTGKGTKGGGALSERRNNMGSQEVEARGGNKRKSQGNRKGGGKETGQDEKGAPRDLKKHKVF